MSAPDATLYGFAYGEDLEGISQRSLGYRLLAPAEPQAWSAEVESLARRLQAAPYPDPWPPTDLFCSVLLADGRRLVAVARYGLADHTPSHRRGGLELIGVVGPGNLDVPTALAIYRWLRKRRADADDLHALGGRFAPSDVTAVAGPVPAPADPVAVLPVRIWQAGVLLFAATAPSDPDHRLGLLEQGAERDWQWLPLTGADFPWQTYAQRGPMIAWTPHLAGVALKLDRKPAEEPTRPSPGRRLLGTVPALLLLFLIVLAAANLWTLLSLRGRMAALPTPAPEGPTPRERLPATATGEEARERFAQALHALLVKQGAIHEWTQPQLEVHYRRAVQEHKDLRVHDTNAEGKRGVGAVSMLSQRSADRVEELVRKALSNKGFDPRLVKTACELVHEQIKAEDGKQ